MLHIANVSISDSQLIQTCCEHNPLQKPSHPPQALDNSSFDLPRVGKLKNTLSHEKFPMYWASEDSQKHSDSHHFISRQLMCA
jgi:hypothetical protein